MKIKEYLESILGNNYYLVEALILGPYPSALFVAELLSKDLPKRKASTGPELTLLIDDGWDISRIEQINELTPQPSVRRVAALDSHGLVHAKIYYFRIQNYVGNYTKRYLLLGSANASLSGFGTHAETYINIDFSDIDPGSRGEVENYIKHLKDGELGTKNLGKCERCEFWVRRNTWVSLPTVRFVNDELIGFDAWLRRGRLCHQYQVDQNFGKLNLHLKKSLPKSELENTLTQFSFGQDTDSKLFSRSYVNDANNNDAHQAPWRGKYFIETNYGFWTSSDCYADRKEEFSAQRSAERKLILEQIESGNSQRDWLNDYLRVLNDVVKHLQPNRAKDYLEFGKDGKLDNIYIERAIKKLNADQIRAKDKDFAGRFTSGFSFVNFPQLGDDFDDFVKNFCKTLLLRMKGQRVLNQLANVLKNELGQHIPDCADNLLERIRVDWAEKPKFRRALIDFHKSN